MELEKTLFMLKPEAVESPELSMVIIEELESIGNCKLIDAVKVNAVTREQIEAFYQEAYQRRGEEMRTYLEYFVGKPVILVLYQGDNIIRRVKEKVGDTDPLKASPDTIRGKFGTDSLEAAQKENNRAVLNLVHAPGSREEFEQNLGVFKSYFEGCGVS